MKYETITLSKFLSRTLGLEGSDLKRITHLDAKTLFPDLKRSTFEHVEKCPEEILTGKIMMVSDGKTIVPYYVPTLKTEFEIQEVKIEYDEVLNRYIEMAINNYDNIEEILNCVEIINEYLKPKTKSIIEKQYVLFNICYKIDDIDIRNKTVILSDIFIGVDKYQDQILNILKQRIENITFEECKGYLNLIRKQENRNLFNDIISTLKNNRNYYIKYISNKYL